MSGFTKKRKTRTLWRKEITHQLIDLQVCASVHTSITLALRRNRAGQSVAVWYQPACNVNMKVLRVGLTMRLRMLRLLCRMESFVTRYSYFWPSRCPVVCFLLVRFTCMHVSQLHKQSRSCNSWFEQSRQKQLLENISCVSEYWTTYVVLSPCFCPCPCFGINLAWALLVVVVLQQYCPLYW